MKKILYTVLLLIFAAVFLFSGYQLLTYFLDSREQSELYGDLASIVEKAKENSPAPMKSGKEDPSDTDEPDAATGEPTVLPEYEELYMINSDMVGWLKIEDTNINYPVMQTPESVDYYLHRNFFKQDNSCGCLYAREQCDINAPSDNITIYGHHMKDGSMLADLSKYNNQEFYETHSEVTFDTLYERHTYQIFAVFKASASVSHGFRYHQFVDAADQEEFDEFIATCKSLAFYDTGITPEYGDKIICLSTCEYTQANGRLVVAAVRID